MELKDSVVVVTGGSGGLGAATAARVARAGAIVVVGDLAEPSEGMFDEVGAHIHFVHTDVTDQGSVEALLEHASTHGAVRGLVHTPGGGGQPTRLVNKQGEPFPLDRFRKVVELNLIGTFNMVRLTAALMSRNDETQGERGCIVMTASVAAYEGQVGQVAYAASKAALVGMNLCAARDLADLGIRVNTIAPGTFDTPLLARFSDEIKSGLAAAVPNPRRLGRADEYAALAEHMLTNEYLNGEVVRLDGAIRMTPR
jgi:NAD(P)-dependent dehydrogenase (short-subunit alcohol dehydrogenase family)